MEHMPHALNHLQHFLSSFLGSKEFSSALIGAVIGGALTAWSALQAQKQAAKDQRQRDEEAERRKVEGVLRAIATELNVLKVDTLDDLNKTLQDRAKRADSGPLMMRRVEQNHAAVFQSNANRIGRINNDDLRGKPERRPRQFTYRRWRRCAIERSHFRLRLLRW
jgi:gas vesicle protein